MNDQRERRRAIERQLFAHPAYIEYEELTAFQQTLAGIFIANGRELAALLAAASENQELALELMQNVRERTVADEFMAMVARALHNYVASSATVGDHSRRLMADRTGPIAEEFERRKQEAMKNPELPFIKDLRNFMLHRKLPFMGHSFQVTRTEDGKAAMRSEVRLSVGELLEWRDWKAPARRFLEALEEPITLRQLIERHEQLMRELNVWLLNELWGALDLTEVNKLRIQRNAVLFGTDFETAKRMSEPGFFAGG
jgi:hypothetical protein